MIIKIILFVVNNNSQKLVLRKAKTFFRDHKPSLTLLLQQVVKVELKCEIPFLGLHRKRVWVVGHIVHFPTLIHFIQHTELSQLLNLETWRKRGEKNVGTKNVTLDCSSSTFTAQTDTLFKTLKGENMVTTLNQQHIPIQEK